jgi:hypothetical protein
MISIQIYKLLHIDMGLKLFEIKGNLEMKLNYETYDIMGMPKLWSGMILHK